MNGKLFIGLFYCRLVGIVNSYSSAHSASNNVEGDNYSLSGYFSDHYNTWDGQSPDSGGYSDLYPSLSLYDSTVTENGFSFTWSGHDIMSRQGVYLHNAPIPACGRSPTVSDPTPTPSNSLPARGRRPLKLRNPTPPRRNRTSTTSTPFSTVTTTPTCTRPVFRKICGTT